MILELGQDGGRDWSFEIFLSKEKIFQYILTGQP